MTNAALMMLVDSRFPAGGHANSAGVEAALHAGDVGDHRSLRRYLEGRLATTGVVDGAFAARATVLAAGDKAAIAEFDAEYTARIPSPRLRDAGRRYGRQLLRAGSAVWSTPLLAEIATVPGGPHQPMVLGALVTATGGTAVDAALISMHHLAAAVTSAGIRLLGLDPLVVSSVQAQVGRDIDRLAADADRWAASPPSELPAYGGSLTDILAEDHGRWDARLFVT